MNNKNVLNISTDLDSRSANIREDTFVCTQIIERKTNSLRAVEETMMMWFTVDK